MKFPLLVAGSLFFIFLLSIVFAASSAPSLPLWDVITGTQDINSTNTGNVGIGVAQAFAKLDVGGGIKLTPNGQKPLCNNRDERGIIWFTSSSDGDYLELCRYNPEGTITTLPNVLPVVISEHSCAKSSANNSFYCFGGNTTLGVGGGLVNSIIKFDPTTNVVTVQNATLPSPRFGLSCTENSLTKLIYCFGGKDGSISSNQIIEYDPILDTIVIKSVALPTVTVQFSCVENSQNHKIYCFGGDQSGGGPSINRITEYDSSTDTIITKNATLPYPTRFLSCVENTATHLIYCIGGEAGFGRITEYNTNTDTLTIKSAALPQTTVGLSCVENNQNHFIYCYGGFNNGLFGSSPISVIEKYDPNTDTITTLQLTLPTPIGNTQCLKNTQGNKVYCIGGITNTVFSNKIVKHQLTVLGWAKITN